MDSDFPLWTLPHSCSSFPPPPNVVIVQCWVKSVVGVYCTIITAWSIDCWASYCPLIFFKNFAFPGGNSFLKNLLDSLCTHCYFLPNNFSRPGNFLSANFCQTLKHIIEPFSSPIFSPQWITRCLQYCHPPIAVWMGCMLGLVHTHLSVTFLHWSPFLHPRFSGFHII